MDQLIIDTISFAQKHYNELCYSDKDALNRLIFNLKRCVNEKLITNRRGENHFEICPWSVVNCSAGPDTCGCTNIVGMRFKLTRLMEHLEHVQERSQNADVKEVLEWKMKGEEMLQNSKITLSPKDLMLIWVTLSELDELLKRPDEVFAFVPKYRRHREFNDIFGLSLVIKQIHCKYIS